jgi:PIN like domain
LSKRRDGKQQPEVLIDRSLGVELAESIRQHGYIVRNLRDVYGEDVAKYIYDEYWIPWAAFRRQLILTKDDRIRRNWLSRDVAFATGARIFCLPNGQLHTPEMRSRILANLNRMVQRWGHDGPYMYAIHADHLSRLWPD